MAKLTKYLSPQTLQSFSSSSQLFQKQSSQSFVFERDVPYHVSLHSVSDLSAVTWVLLQTTTAFFKPRGRQVSRHSNAVQNLKQQKENITSPNNITLLLSRTDSRDYSLETERIGIHANVNKSHTVYFSIASTSETNKTGWLGRIGSRCFSDQAKGALLIER